MPPTPEQRARVTIDRLLTAAGWAVQDVATADIHAQQGVALREFPLSAGHGGGAGPPARSGADA